MIYRRQIVLYEDALSFLEDYESVLTRVGIGYSDVLREQAAAVIIDTLYRKLVYGALQNRPQYVGLDITKPRFSLFDFDEDFISGRYRSDGDEVHVLSLKLNEIHLLVAILGTLDAQVKVA